MPAECCQGFRWRGKRTEDYGDHRDEGGSREHEQVDQLVVISDAKEKVAQPAKENEACQKPRSDMEQDGDARMVVCT